MIATPSSGQATLSCSLRSSLPWENSNGTCSFLHLDARHLWNPYNMGSYLRSQLCIRYLCPYGRTTTASPLNCVGRVGETRLARLFFGYALVGPTAWLVRPLTHGQSKCLIRSRYVSLYYVITCDETCIFYDEMNFVHVLLHLQTQSNERY